MNDQETLSSVEFLPADFVHRFIAARNVSKSSAKIETYLLLHGTGGDENDLLPLGLQLAGERDDIAYLSPRGQVLENGAPRFFRRLAEGVFDEADLRIRTHQLDDFINRAASKYKLDGQNITAIGYSNGANIAASLLLLHPGTLRRAVLLHAMIPHVPDEMPNLNGTQILLTAGRRDPIVTPANTERLHAMLKERV